MSPSAPKGPIGGDFRIFVQKMALQGFYALGVIDIPGAPKQERANVEAARMVIEDLKMLREKTGSNLDPGERMTLDKYIADLQMQVIGREAEAAE